MEGVKLIGAIGSRFCVRIEWALKLKGVEYEYIKEDLRNKSPILLKYNPVHKKVPVLVHNGEAVSESLVILEYIDEVWKKNPLLPQDPHGRATARFWAKFSDEKIMTGAWQAGMFQGEEKNRAIVSLQESLEFIEKELEGKIFFGGENIGYLDLVMGWIPTFLEVMEEVEQIKLLDAEKFPLLHKWSQNFLGLSRIEECIPPRELLAAYIRRRISAFRSQKPNNYK